MFSFFKRKPPYTPSEIAAGYIEAFANDNLQDPYAWDDFELAPEGNAEVILAIRLCWYVAGEFPARHDREYMAPEGKPYFRKIAKLLRKGKLAEYSSLNLEKVKQGGFPEKLHKQLGLSECTPRGEPVRE